MSNLTIIYYTSNREHPKIEKNVIKSLLESSKGLPIISVSQKPLDLGKNICVGDVGISEINLQRQCLIGIQEAKTKYVAMAESDFLYPPMYFDFRPQTDDAFYLANPVYVIFIKKGIATNFSPKRHGSEGAMISSREYLIEMKSKLLNGCPEWSAREANENRNIGYQLKKARWHTFYMMNPVVTVKTKFQLHKRTPTIYSRRQKNIPYWGNSHELKRRLLS